MLDVMDQMTFAPVAHNSCFNAKDPYDLENPEIELLIIHNCKFVQSIRLYQNSAIVTSSW